jgi:hypothetical protein
MNLRAERDGAETTSDCESLTETERQVARLVAEWHPKLGLRSRVDLTRLVVERTARAPERVAS